MTQDKARKIANEYMASALRQIPLAQDIRAYGHQRREEALKEAAEVVRRRESHLGQHEHIVQAILAPLDQPQEDSRERD